MDRLTGIKVGPIRLVPGVTRLNFWSFLYASFIVIGMLAGLNLMQPYVLSEILKLPLEVQGTVSGNLGTWQEVVAILLINPFGWLADRIGRRPLMTFGIFVCGIGLALYPFATSVDQLAVFRVIFAVGSACLAALIAIVGNDYPHEASRGTLIGFGNAMNGVGVLFVSGVILQIPRILTNGGTDPVVAGKIMFGTAAVMCVLSAFWFRVGLKSGTGQPSADKPDWGVLMLSGFKAARNPRILLSYGAAFIGRADVSIKGMFLMLWASAAGPAAGLSPAEAMGRGGILMAVLAIVGMFWVGIFGMILDRVNRVTGMAIAMGLAGAGYSSMWLVSSPLDFSNLPWFILLAVGQTSAICASVTLVGQEAQPAERGAVVAMNGFFGALGILVAFAVGGRLFDMFGPASPFVMVGLFQLLLFFAAVAVRVMSPGVGGAPGSAGKPAGSEHAD